MKENNNHSEKERNNKPRKSRKQKAGIVMGALAIVGAIIGSIIGGGGDGSDQA